MSPLFIPKTVTVPELGVWRVARGDDPLKSSWIEPMTANAPRGGNRFDSENFGVVYFATSLEACFGEVLARYRPDPAVQRIAEQQWEELGFVCMDGIPAEWRDRRVAINVTFGDSAQFLDVEDLDTLHHLRGELALGLAALGHNDLDLGITRGPDRLANFVLKAT